MDKYKVRCLQDTIQRYITSMRFTDESSSDNYVVSSQTDKYYR